MNGALKYDVVSTVGANVRAWLIAGGSFAGSTTEDTAFNTAGEYRGDRGDVVSELHFD